MHLPAQTPAAKRRHAISLNVVLVTNNTRDFSAYPGLVLENWIESVH